MGKLPIPVAEENPENSISDMLKEIGPQSQSTPRKGHEAAKQAQMSYDSGANIANSIDDLANLPGAEGTLEIEDIIEGMG